MVTRPLSRMRGALRLARWVVEEAQASCRHSHVGTVPDLPLRLYVVTYMYLARSRARASSASTAYLNGAGYSRSGVATVRSLMTLPVLSVPFGSSSST